MGNKKDQLIQSFDSSAASYDDETNTFHHKISEYLTIENLLLELPKDKNISILDSGGGTGKFSIFLAKLGYKVHLTDISSKSIEIFKQKCIKEKLNIPCTVCDIENTPFENDKFDLIMLNGAVISYTPDPDKLLKECFRTLKPGGILWFDFLNSLGWALETHDIKYRMELASVNDEKSIQMPDWDYPSRVFTLDHIRDMLDSSGYKIKSEYGLVLLSNSLNLGQRYSKNYDNELLAKYKELELQISRNKDCFGSSWSIYICAIKKV